GRVRGPLSALLVGGRLLRLGTQGRLWAWGYGGLLLLVAGCALALRRAARAPATASETVRPLGSADDPSAPARDTAAAPITAARRARWIALAALPSSLMLSVTTYISTDTAALPPLLLL